MEIDILFVCGVVGCGLWVVGCGLWVVGCGPSAIDKNYLMTG